jgi:hypothetical protein
VVLNKVILKVLQEQQVRFLRHVFGFSGFDIQQDVDVIVPKTIEDERNEQYCI